MELKHEGLDELAKFCDELQISDAKCKRAVSEGGEIILNSILENTHVRSGNMKRKIKKTITRLEGDVACKIKAGAYYSTFEDWGTSQNKKNVAFFENAVDDSSEKAVKVVENYILKRL